MRYNKIYFSILSFFIIVGILWGQEHPSIHQQEWEFYQNNPDAVQSIERSFSQTEKKFNKPTSIPNAVVYGFHPYWMNGAESNYQFDLLTHLAYFSADVDPATGNFSSTHNYSTATVITQAKNAGLKVHLTIVCFTDHAVLFGNQSSVDRLVNNIIAKVKERNIDGVNIDFESMNSSDNAPFKKFILQLGDSLKKHQKELCVELFAVDWDNTFPSSFFTDVDPVVDQYFVMLYAYFYSKSPTAGPNAPMRNSTASGYHVLKSIDTYLNRGCPPKKLIAGFPYYGNDWPVVSSARMAATTGTGSSRFYNVAKNNYLDTMKAENLFFDATYATPWYRYHNGTSWRQTWYDDSLSLAMKYDSVKIRKLSGVGMWALGYDGSEPELWNLLRNKFTTPLRVEKENTLPAQFTLSQNYPNPFNPGTTITFAVHHAEYVNLTVFNSIGQSVETLFYGVAESNTPYTLHFDSNNLSSGTYFYLLRSASFHLSRKMVLLR
ncbi:MAG: glycosyl hydrolase family 18 protein [Bacteroidota bacterium]